MAKNIDNANTIEFTADKYDSEAAGVDFQKKLKSTASRAGTLKQDIHVVCQLALRDYFITKNSNWIMYVINAYNPHSGSLRVQAIIHWFQTFGGVLIENKKDGTVGVTKDKKFKQARDAETFAQAKKIPFYKLAPPEQPIKAPEVSFTAVAAMLARREFLGEEPNWENQLEEMKKAYSAAKSSKSFGKWKEKAKVALEEGEIEYINAPVANDEQPLVAAVAS